MQMSPRRTQCYPHLTLQNGKAVSLLRLPLCNKLSRNLSGLALPRLTPPYISDVKSEPFTRKFRNGTEFLDKKYPKLGFPCEVVFQEVYEIGKMLLHSSLKISGNYNHRMKNSLSVLSSAPNKAVHWSLSLLKFLKPSR